ncbi:oxidoreductase [Brevibacterium renqingii]|uniref:oxidoreductase n=1 Tax=Brevibacterium renqingii TaxID=2776916 RepID=UPI001ADED621|nr:oxidoreductase [Brevibacterium renqingii]
MLPITTALDRGFPSLDGQTFVITGANSGLGRVTAGALAAHGAHVVLAVRNLKKGAEAAATMTGSVEVRELDLADLGSVRSFAAGLGGPIDVLINNAGIMTPPLSWTVDGFESQFGTNHLGHFALTALLLPQIGSRVVTVSSLAHKQGTIDFTDLNWRHRRYRAMAAYAQSKLANLLFTTELERRLTKRSSDVIATAAHPGLAATNLFGPGDRRRLRDNLGKALTRLLSQSDTAGAAPMLNAAVADVPGNSYLGPGRAFETRGEPVFASRAPVSLDEDVARRLWEASESLTGIGFLGSSV